MILATVLVEDLDPKVGKKIVFRDEFSGTGLPDKKKWKYEVGVPNKNGEPQYYTENRLENCRKAKGNLVIEGRKEKFKGADITSAALESNQSFLYGYFEVRAKVPTGRGTWPAIWFLGQSLREKGSASRGWPLCGEIDLMENVGYDPDQIHFSIHTKKYNHIQGTQKTHTITVPKASEGFHTYGLDWKPNVIDFYFDGKKVYTYANDHTGEEAWPFDKPIYMILNMAIGGFWGGAKGIDDSIFPCQFLVDYVRVYR